MKKFFYINNIEISMSPEYVVHENHGAWKYTSIHLSDCPHAKPAGTKTQNTQWYGPYDSYRKAREKVKKLAQKTHKDCSDCMRRKSWKLEEK